MLLPVASENTAGPPSSCSVSDEWVGEGEREAYWLPASNTLLVMKDMVHQCDEAVKLRRREASRCTSALHFGE